MAINRKTSDEFAADIEDSILSRNTNYDTKIGPIPDLIIQPLANVLEIQNERMRVVQQLLSLANADIFVDRDLDDFVYNELLVRLSGSKARVVLTFSRVAAPTADVTVRANFPVATLADEDSGGGAITFATLIDTTMVAANAASYFNPTTQRYELQVVADAVSPGSVGNVGAYRIVRPLRALSGFDSVINNAAASGGRDTESNSELIDRYFLSLLGTSPSVATGLKKILSGKFTQVLDANVVYGNNPLNVRSSTDGGAVDVYVIGSAATTVTETVTFAGVNQTMVLSNQPVQSITSVTGYTQNSDYVLVKSTDGNAESVRASDGLRFIVGGSAPAVNTVITVTYVYNGLMQQLQSQFSTADMDVPGRDLLFKQATLANITISANIRIRSGYNSAQVLNTITTAILSFVNALKLGNNVEVSDIQAVVRAYSAVDNFIITNIAKFGETGLSDIQIGQNEYARLVVGNLSLTVI